MKIYEDSKVLDHTIPPEGETAVQAQQRCCGCKVV